MLICSRMWSSLMTWQADVWDSAQLTAAFQNVSNKMNGPFGIRCSNGGKMQFNNQLLVSIAQLCYWGMFCQSSKRFTFVVPWNTSHAQEVTFPQEWVCPNTHTCSICKQSGAYLCDVFVEAATVTKCSLGQQTCWGSFTQIHTCHHQAQILCWFYFHIMNTHILT